MTAEAAQDERDQPLDNSGLLSMPACEPSQNSLARPPHSLLLPSKLLEWYLCWHWPKTYQLISECKRS